LKKIDSFVYIKLVFSPPFLVKGVVGGRRRS